MKRCSFFFFLVINPPLLPTSRRLLVRHYELHSALDLPELLSDLLRLCCPHNEHEDEDDAVDLAQGVATRLAGVGPAGAREVGYGAEDPAAQGDYDGEVVGLPAGQGVPAL